MFLSNKTEIILPSNEAECIGCSTLLYGHRRKFCNSQCRTKYYNKQTSVSRIEKSRTCTYCEGLFFKSRSGLLNYCSKDCQKRKKEAQNKNPFTKTSIKERRIPLHRNVVDSRTTCSYDEVVIDNAIMEHLESLCNEDESYVQEDLEWLERVLKEEQTSAFYKDGTPYRPDPISYKLRRERQYWWREPFLSRYRRRASHSWYHKSYKKLYEMMIKKQIYKMSYGERKKFMASIKVKSTTNTPTTN